MVKMWLPWSLPWHQNLCFSNIYHWLTTSSLVFSLHTSEKETLFSSWPGSSLAGLNEISTPVQPAITPKWEFPSGVSLHWDIWVGQSKLEEQIHWYVPCSIEPLDFQGACGMHMICVPACGQNLPKAFFWKSCGILKRVGPKLNVESTTSETELQFVTYRMEIIAPTCWHCLEHTWDNVYAVLCLARGKSLVNEISLTSLMLYEYSTTENYLQYI